ncbi:MAG: tRNA pseudouridine(55) synthase TruB [Lachnospiraceae bacterium]|nr:tRNA pseudouridine(55) synthase TruB [Lachnospiraceae bacterium]
MHHGMLTVYKEAGYTSSDAVARLRGILRMRKIGHTGTLDPDAEGVLPMCLGNATRICELIADREKEYLAVMRLGVVTDTQDMSGEILSQIPEEQIPAILLQSNADVTAIAKGNPVLNADEAKEGDPEATAKEKTEDSINRRIREAAAAFTGEIDQIPPMYSAIKVNGKRLYDMARKGITVERKARRITIYSLDVEKVELPLVTMRVRCSKGTYIRTLCEDLGKALGTGAAMQSLLRTRVGQFTLQEARTLDELEHIAKTEPEQLLPLIRPVDSFFVDLPAASCSPEALRLLKNGNTLTTDEFRFLTAEEDPRKVFRAVENDKIIEEAAENAIDKTTDKTIDESIHESIDESVDLVLDTASLPGIQPGEKVIRMYDADGIFYGLYKNNPLGRNRGLYSAYKMFLPEVPKTK